MGILSGDTVSGWIVIHDQSSRFVAIFDTETEARQKASLMGVGYIAGYGQKEKISDNYNMEQKLA